jgi:hypothetical protein
MRAIIDTLGFFDQTKLFHCPREIQVFGCTQTFVEYKSTSPQAHASLDASTSD